MAVDGTWNKGTYLLSLLYNNLFLLLLVQILLSEPFSSGRRRYANLFVLSRLICKQLCLKKILEDSGASLIVLFT